MGIGYCTAWDTYYIHTHTHTHTHTWKHVSIEVAHEVIIGSKQNCTEHIHVHVPLDGCQTQNGLYFLQDVEYQSQKHH